MHIRTGFALSLLLALGLVGCGRGDNSDDGVATAGNPSSSASSSAQPDQLTDEERSRKYAQCMREHGINMPDPDSGNGRFQLKLPKGADPQKVQAAQEQCKKYLPNGGEPLKMDPQQLEQARKLAKCMRENGVPNFPDPDPNGGFKVQASPGSGIDPDDPTFKAAQKACEKYQPSGPSARSTTGPGGNS